MRVDRWQGLSKATPILSASGLCRVFSVGDIEHRALRGVSLDVSSGQLVSILGEPGAGKSTLLNLLGGMDQPSSGEVLFRGTPLPFGDQRLLNVYRRDHVGFVYPFFTLVAGLSARDNVALVARLSANAIAPDEALAIVGLAGTADQPTTAMTAGEQQRVAIARAIVKRPDILLCDEPTRLVGRAEAAAIGEAIRAANKALGITVLVTGTEADGIDGADRRIRLANGGVVRDSLLNAPVTLAG